MTVEFDQNSMRPFRVFRKGKGENTTSYNHGSLAAHEVHYNLKLESGEQIKAVYHARHMGWVETT